MEPQWILNIQIKDTLNLRRFGVDNLISKALLSSTLALEIQYLEQDIVETTLITNTFISYTLSRASKYSISELLEINNDPFLQNTNKKEVYYPSVAVTYQFCKNNKLTTFYGKRRDGPACS
jgi:hypothetical protein